MILNRVVVSCHHPFLKERSSMAVQGDLLYAKCQAYIYDTSTRTLIEKIGYGTFNWTIPYLNSVGFPGTGKITENETPTALMGQWQDWMPDFNFLSGAACELGTSDYGANFRYWFPSAHVVHAYGTYPHLCDYVVENVDSGAVLWRTFNSSATGYAASLEDYENFRGTGSISHLSDVLRPEMNTGTQPTLGRMSALVYTSLNNYGRPSNFRTIKLGGTRSNSGRISLIEVSTGYEEAAFINFFMVTRNYTHGDPYVNPDAESPEVGRVNREDGGPESTHGNPDRDVESDPIAIPDVPSVSVADSGFITLFNPTVAQLKSLADFMWSSEFDISLFKAVHGNPIDCILGLSLVPVAVPNESTATAVTVGNIPTTVSMYKATSQYVELDCGTITLPEFFAAYLDYAPYTKIEIYLPYVGYRQLDVDNVVNKEIGVKYHVDILSGACVAYVTTNGSVMYQFTGNCAEQIPITSVSYDSMISTVVSMAAALGAAVATKGASAAVQGMAGATVAGAAAGAVMNQKPDISKGGAIGGASGLLSVQKPYLIITRPIQCVPEAQAGFEGYPSFITDRLGNFSGYTVVEAVHVEVPCTDAESMEIESLLKGGVIL